jgi:rhodanese-related sulfurtransferase
MIRDRIKGALRKAALKAFGMEWEAEERTRRKTKGSKDGSYDASVIPKIVDGDGDTPGPKHLELIGRTWLAAQLAGGVPGTIVDIRPPEETALGVIPGSILLPHKQILANTHLLPDPKLRVTVLDADGDQGSTDVARLLRDAGWGWSRSLQGGWAEWLEHSEPDEKPAAVDGCKYGIGGTVSYRGRPGVVQAAYVGGSYDVLLDYAGDEVAKGVAEADLG